MARTPVAVIKTQEPTLLTNALASILLRAGICHWEIDSGPRYRDLPEGVRQWINREIIGYEVKVYIGVEV